MHCASSFGVLFTSWHYERYLNLNLAKRCAIYSALALLGGGKGNTKMAAETCFPEEECFSFYWKIKNFSFCGKQIKSPEFRIGACKYYLLIYLKWVDVECEFMRLDLLNISRNATQISFLTCDGSPEFTMSGDKCVKLKVARDIIFGSKRKALLPDDTLTVRYQRLTTDGRGKMFACSEIGVKRKYFLWNLRDSEFLMSKSIEDSKLYGDIMLHLTPMGGINSEEQFNIEVSKTGGETCSYALKVSLLDVNGKVLNEVGSEFVLERMELRQTRGIPSLIKRSKWIGNKNLLSSDNVFSLKCHLAMSPGRVAEETAVVSSCQSTAALLKEMDSLKMSFENKKDSSCVTDLQIDLKGMLKNGTFYDASLQVGSEVIPVHKSILSARSPVFMAMFTKDMTEANSNTVLIEDFDVETVRGLLLYMYTNTIDDEQWENIRNLYLVSDKYEVLSLKGKCSSLLKCNLSVSNVSEALVLADLHQDEDLRKAAIDFISEYDSAVFASEAWIELEKKCYSVALQALRQICCNRRFR